MGNFERAQALYRGLPPGVKEAVAPLKPLMQKLLRGTPSTMPAYSTAPSPNADYWGNRHLDDAYWSGMIHWGQIPIVAEALNRRISGDPKVDYIEYTKAKYIIDLRRSGRPVRMLSLCSGIGQLERQMLRSGFCDSVVGFEVSQACVDQANASAIAEGLGDRARFVASDLNTVNFGQGEAFDVILNEAALHHISGLEHLLAECRRVSHPGTIFVNHDYIGPNHHQWTDQQLRIINTLLSFFPNELKGSRSNPGAIHFSRKAHTLKEMLQIDPTEGVRSADTLKVMADHFTIVERCDFGGTILHLLFNDIAGNFIAPQHEALVRTLVYLEDLLIESGKLSSDFSYWIGRPR